MMHYIYNQNQKTSQKHEQSLKKLAEKEEQRELRVKIKEFSKKYFTYNQIDKNISVKVKQELEKLGATKPFYFETENDRTILLINLWKSDNEEVKNIILVQAQEYFSTNDREKIIALLDNIYQKKINTQERMKKMRETRDNSKFSY